LTVVGSPDHGTRKAMEHRLMDYPFQNALKPARAFIMPSVSFWWEH